MGGYNIERLYSENLDEEMLFATHSSGLEFMCSRKRGSVNITLFMERTMDQPIESLLFRERIRPL